MPPQGAAVEIVGGRELRRTLRKAGVDMTQLREANRKSAAIAAPAAVAKSPQVSGKLKGSIKPLGSQTMARVRIGRKAVPYAAPIHWGWHRRHIKPNEFGSRAVKETEPRWFRAYTSAVEKILDTIKGA